MGRNLFSVGIRISSYAFYIHYKLMPYKPQVALSLPRQPPEASATGEQATTVEQSHLLCRIQQRLLRLLCGSMFCINCRMITDVWVPSKGL